MVPSAVPQEQGAWQGGSSSIVVQFEILSDGGALWNMYFGAGSAPGAADEAVYVYREGAALGEGVALGAMGAERKLLRARVQRLRARVEVLAAAAAGANCQRRAGVGARIGAEEDQVKPVDVLRQLASVDPSVTTDILYRVFGHRADVDLSEAGTHQQSTIALAGGAMSDVVGGRDGAGASSGVVTRAAGEGEGDAEDGPEVQDDVQGNVQGEGEDQGQSNGGGGAGGEDEGEDEGEGEGKAERGWGQR